MALAMWEACWANYITDYFHLFLCLAILSVYADDVIAQDLHTDEMLLHFSSLAMFMDGHLILRKVKLISELKSQFVVLVTFYCKRFVNNFLFTGSWPSSSVSTNALHSLYFS